MSWRGEVLVAGVTIVALALLGAPVGLLWAHIAPHVHTMVTKDGVGLTDYETEAFFAADALFPRSHLPRRARLRRRRLLAEP